MGVEIPELTVEQFIERYIDMLFLPSSADLDAVAEEQRIKELTNGKTDQQGA